MLPPDYMRGHFSEALYAKLPLTFNGNSSCRMKIEYEMETC